MRSANIADLKNRLTQYLREVRAGEEIIVCDRNRPIAKIVPLAPEEDDGDAALVAAGLMRPAERRLPASFWTSRRARLSRAEVVAAVAAEREDR
jgi:prevent-host-death family protein